MNILKTLVYSIFLFYLGMGSAFAIQPESWICGSSRFRTDQVKLYNDLGAGKTYKKMDKGTRLLPPVVGTTRNFWVWDLSVMPPLNVQIPATCRAVGTNCYVFVQDSQWMVNVDPADVNIIQQNFDNITPADPGNGIYQLCTGTFGPAPDIHDSDPKIYILIFDMADYMGFSFDGYWNVYDEYTDAEAMTYGQRSNEIEIIYIDCNPTNPSADVTLGVIAHEFQHMLHWNADPDEEAWVNEGCAEYAMHLCGYPTDHLEDAYAANPDVNLTVWNQKSADYGKSKLFAIYLAEHYGGASIISRWVAQPENSVIGLNNALALEGYSQTLRDIFPDWVIANYLDTPGIYGDKYYYAMIDFPAMVPAATHNRGILPTNGNVKTWANDYILFTTEPVPLYLFFNGDAGGDFVVQVMNINTSDPSKTKVNKISLDSSNSGNVSIPGFGSNFDNVVMSVSSLDGSSASPINYSYLNATFSRVPTLELISLFILLVMGGGFLIITMHGKN